MRSDRDQVYFEGTPRETLRVLWLLPYSPWPPDHGGKLRVWNILGRLQQHGVSVEAWYIDHGEEENPPEMPGVIWRRFQGRERSGYMARVRCQLSHQPVPTWEAQSSALKERVRAIYSAAMPDLLVLEQAHMASYSAAAPPTAKRVLIAQNIEYLLTAQLANSFPRARTRIRYRLEVGKTRRFEAAAFQSADAVVVMSDQDRARALPLAGKTPVLVHPNGVSPSDYRFPPRGLIGNDALTAPVVLFIGTLGYQPNADGIRWFCERVAPRIRDRVPNVEFRVVGSRPPKEILVLDDPVGTGVNVVGRVEDVRGELERAHVFVVPLRMGSGTRLKALEAMAAGVPIVGTTVGLEGLTVVSGSVADTEEEMAQAVYGLLSNREVARDRAHLGRRLAESIYDWDVLVPRLVADLRRLSLRTV